MKRIGYVGLSTPVFYDYEVQASVAPSDQHSSPNPIVEGAFGAILLFDELWFLCRSLCPENMRNLPYVRFLDEEGRVPEIDPDWLSDPSDVFDPAALATFHRASSSYEEVKRRAHVHWDAAPDNHTHGLTIGEAHFVGNSWNVKNVIFDTLMAERLGADVELITNSFSASLFATEASVRDRLELTEVLILKSVPQFITPNGPYHPCVEEVRESRYLCDFRKWMTTEAPTASQKDVREVKADVDAKIEESKQQVFLKYLDHRGLTEGVAQTMLSAGLDTLIPGIGVVKDLLGDLKVERERRAIRWQGFVVEARAKLDRM